MEHPRVTLHDLGLVDYKETWDFQETLLQGLVAAKRQGETKPTNHLILCQHPNVFTIGKSGNAANVLFDPSRSGATDASYYQINRGGDVTFHGPGQLVVYPIFDLEQFFKDIHKYMRFLEECVIKTLSSFGVHGERIVGLTGVWVPGNPAKKIAAFGVKCSRWVTMHGIGFNINTDLSYFNQIIPCGINDMSVTSLEKELGVSVNMYEVKNSLLKHLEDLFNYNMITAIHES